MQHTDITIKRLKLANPIFFSPAVIAAHEDIGLYTVDKLERTLTVTRKGDKQIVYSIDNNFKLKFKKTI